MPNLFTPDTFDFFARYLLAGFIIFSVRARFVVTRRAKPTEFVFELVVLSLINQLVFLVLALPFTPPEAGRPGRIAFLGEVLILPALLGIVFGLNLRRGWNAAILRRISLPVAEPIDNAWDRTFADGVRPGLVIITYKDGAQIMGRFGGASFAGTSGARDMFLETLYEMYGDEPDEWIESYPFRSAYVTLDDVRSIEFLEEHGDEADDFE